MNVSRLSCANKLEIQLDKYDEYVDFEKKFKLKEDGDYNSLDTIKKLEVMKKLQYNYPESGIRNFDNISITAIIISGFGFPILYYFIDQSQCVAIPFDYIVIIDAVVTIAASVIICHIINEAGPNEERTKEAIKNVKDEIEREKCS